MLASVFGFDKYTDITSEQAIRGTYCDLAVKLDDKIKYLIEVKAVGLNLKENHLRQAINYGANHGIPWVVLTNGIEWQIYKISFERPIAFDLVCIIDFITINAKKSEDQDKIFLLCKEGIAKAAIEEFHDHIQSVNRFIIGALILSDPLISLLRRELRKISPGVKVTDDEIRRITSSEVLKRDIVESEPATEAMKRVKKVINHKPRKKSSHAEDTDNKSEAINNESSFN